MREIIGIAGLCLIAYAVWDKSGAVGLSLFVGIVLLLVGLFGPGKTGKDANK